MAGCTHTSLSFPRCTRRARDSTRRASWCERRSSWCSRIAASGATPSRRLGGLWSSPSRSPREEARSRTPSQRQRLRPRSPGGQSRGLAYTATGQRTTVPRHKEIKPPTARGICRQLGVPVPTGSRRTPPASDPGRSTAASRGATVAVPSWLLGRSFWQSTPWRGASLPSGASDRAGNLTVTNRLAQPARCSAF